MKSDLVTFTLLPVIYKAPPSTKAELTLNIDFVIVALSPVRQTVPPLELELVAV